MVKTELIKKEINEYIKTPKGIILLAVFVFFALSSPLMGRYMNEIIATVAPDIVFDFPEPSLVDGWGQVFKNFSSICIIVFLILMTGTVSQEKSKGSILLVLTKKVSRFEFILSKFLVGSLAFTILFIGSSFISAWYINSLFGSYIYDGLFMSLLLFWLMGIFFTALAVFVSVIGKTPTTSALMGFAGYGILQILNISIDLSLFNPSGAPAIVNEIMKGTIQMSEMWKPIVVSILAVGFFFSAAQYFFKRQEI